jgi:hypothetical protein
MRSRTSWLAGMVAAALSACSGKTEHGGSASPSVRTTTAPSGPVASATTTAPRRHLLVVLEVEPAARSGRVLLARAVDLPLPRRRGPERSEPWRVEVLGADGAVVFSAPLADASERRGEFPDPQTGELRGVKVHERVTAVTVRLPELAGASTIRLVNVAQGSELCRVAYPQVAP